MQPKLGSKFKLPGKTLKFGAGLSQDSEEQPDRTFFQAFLGCNNTFDHTASPFYVPINGQLAYPDERAVQMFIPEDGVLKNFVLKVTSTNTMDASGTAVIMKNGVATTLTLTVPAGSTALFQDNTHEVSVKKNDLVYIKMTTASTLGEWIGVSYTVQYQKT